MSLRFTLCSLWLALCLVTGHEVLGEISSDEAMIAMATNQTKNELENIDKACLDISSDANECEGKTNSIPKYNTQSATTSTPFIIDDNSVCRLDDMPPLLSKSDLPITTSCVDSYYVPVIVMVLAAPAMNKLLTEYGPQAVSGLLTNYRTSVNWGGLVGLFIVLDMQYIIPHLATMMPNEYKKFVLIPISIGVAISGGSQLASSNDAFMNYEPKFNPNQYSHLCLAHFVKNVVAAFPGYSKQKQDLMSYMLVKVGTGTGSIFLARVVLDYIHLHSTSPAFLPVAFALSGGLNTVATIVLKQVAPSWVEFEDHSPTFSDLVLNVVQSGIIGITVYVTPLVLSKLSSLTKGMVYAHAKKD